MKTLQMMRTPVTTVDASLPAEEAWRLMEEEHIRHLVVLGEGEVLGVLSERDLGGTRGRSVRLGQAVGELMSGEVVTVQQDMDVRDAAALLSGCRVGCLPVLDGDQLVGIITRADFIELLAGPAVQLKRSSTA